MDTIIRDSAAALSDRYLQLSDINGESIDTNATGDLVVTDSLITHNLDVQGDITITGSIINNGWRHDLDTTNAWMTRADTCLVLPVRLLNADSTAKYGDSSIATHPSILYFPDAKWGFKYWLAGTPLAPVGDQDENPHIWVSNDRITWDSIPGWANPLFGISGSGASVDSLVTATHLADVDLCETHDGNIALVFRATYGSDSDVVKVSVFDSTSWTVCHDGTADSLNGTILAEAADLNKHLLSPAMIPDTNETYTIFAIQANYGQDTTFLKRWSSAYVDSNYSANGTPTWTSLGDSGYWHMDIIPFGADELVMMAHQIVSADGGATNGTLRMLVSANDGDTWTPVNKQLLTGSGVANDFDSNFVYRPSPYWIEEGDELAMGVFYGAKGRRSNFWGIGHGIVHFSDSNVVTAYTETTMVNLACDFIAGNLDYRDQTPTDSFVLTLEGFSADSLEQGALILVDSCIDDDNNANDRFAAVWQCMPTNTVRLDTLIVIGRGYGANTAEIDSVYLYGPDSTQTTADKRLLADVSWDSVNVTWAVTDSMYRYTWTLGQGGVMGEDPITVWFVTITDDNKVWKGARIYLKASVAKEYRTP